MIPTVPVVMTRKPDGPLHRVNTFLDVHVLPYPVKFLTNRIVKSVVVDLVSGAKVERKQSASREIALRVSRISRLILHEQ